MRWFTGHGGVRLAADERGSGSPTVLFLHGGGQTRHSWAGALDVVAARGLRAVTLDHRGHGESERAPDGDYRMDAFAGDVRAVVTELGPTIAVGASLGGLAALSAEGDAPLLRGLVLVDIAHRIEPEGVARIYEFMTARPDGFASLEEAADAVAEYLPHRERPSDLSGLARNLRERPDGRLVWHWDPALWSEWSRAGRREVERYERAARGLRLPTLLVRGARSDVLSEEGARAFLELVPHARYANLADAHHMVAGDRNDAFLDAVLGFLAEL